MAFVTYVQDEDDQETARKNRDDEQYETDADKDHALNQNEQNPITGRAGVRTVSSTEPYTPEVQAAFADEDQFEEDELIPFLEEPEEELQTQEDTDPEPQEQWRRHMVESAHSGRSRSRTSRPQASQREERSRSRDDVRTPQRPDLSWRRQLRQAADIHRRDDSRSRTSARSRDRSVESSIARQSASPTRHGWTSRATPANLPAAQHDPVCKPVLEGHTPVGYIWADPVASAVEVVISMHRELKIAVAIDTNPHTC